MRKQEGEVFLTSLAAERDVRAATQGQGLSAILFLYREVLEHLLLRLDEVTRTKRPGPVSSVMSREKVQRLLAGVDEPLPGLIIAPPDMRNCRERGLFARPVDLSRRNLPFPSAVQGRRVIHRP